MLRSHAGLNDRQVLIILNNWRTALAFFFTVATISAAPLYTATISFEQPILLDGGHTFTILNPWTLKTPGGVPEAAGVFNPGPSSTTGGLVPHGSNTLFVSNGTPTLGPSSVMFDVGVFSEGWSYNYTFMVGRRLDVPYGGFLVTLGLFYDHPATVYGQPIRFQSVAQQPDDPNAPPPGGWIPVTMRVSPNAFGPVFEVLPITIKLQTLRTENALNSSQTLFDAFTIEAESVPEPATILICGGGLLALACVGRRRLRD